MKLESLLTEIEKRASAATPGPWTAHDNHGTRYVSNGKDGKFAKFDNRVCEAVFNLHLSGDNKNANMDFIATLNPATALKLVAIIKTQVETLKKIAHTIDSAPTDESGSGPCRLHLLESRNRRILEAQKCLEELDAILNEGEK